MTTSHFSQYQKNLEHTISEFRQGNIIKSGEYMDRNYLMLFQEYDKIGDILNQVKEILEDPYLSEATELKSLELLNSLNKLLTAEGNLLREHFQLQQTGKIPTNCPTE